jgi:hypothetical protein
LPYTLRRTSRQEDAVTTKKSERKKEPRSKAVEVKDLRAAKDTVKGGTGHSTGRRT